MTYRHDSEIYLSYGTFINKTNKEKIKPNAFLKYDEKSHSVFNLTRYKIPELSQRKKGVTLQANWYNTCSRQSSLGIVNYFF